MAHHCLSCRVTCLQFRPSLQASVGSVSQRTISHTAAAPGPGMPHPAIRLYSAGCRAPLSSCGFARPTLVTLLETSNQVSSRSNARAGSLRLCHRVQHSGRRLAPAAADAGQSPEDSFDIPSDLLQQVSARRPSCQQHSASDAVSSNSRAADRGEETTASRAVEPARTADRQVARQLSSQSGRHSHLVS